MSSYADLMKLFNEKAAEYAEFDEWARLHLIAIRPLTNENKIH